MLVTRPAAEAIATGERLASLGYAPILAPMLEIRVLPKDLPHAQAILLTSGNAVAGLPDPALWAGQKVLAVGDATAARARAQGFANVMSAGGDAEALAALALQVCHPGRGPLLLACGRRQGSALAARLRAANFRVVRRTVYETNAVASFPHPAAEALAKQRVHAALFLSAETAAAFVRLLPSVLCPSLSRVCALAIGAPAADVLKSLPWREVRLAAAPTLDDVLALL